MTTLTSRQMCGITKYRCLFKKRLYFRYPFRKLSDSRWASALDDFEDEQETLVKKIDKTSRIFRQVDISEKELEIMFNNRIYNTETWDMVINYKKMIEVNKRVPWKSHVKSSDATQTDPDSDLSVIAKIILESSGYDLSSANSKKAVDAATEKQSTDDSDVSLGKKSFPFAPTDIEGIRDKLLQHKPTSSSNLDEHVILKETFGFDTLPDVPETFSTDVLDSETLQPISNQKKMEKVSFEEPYQRTPNAAQLNQNQESWKIFYGTPDPNFPISDVPCGGCGAHLHCQDSALAGYLPSEILKEMKRVELQDVICQRCTFLRDYNIALNLSVPPDTYPEIISKIKEKRALIILMVDLLDFPCSIWPGIIDLVGPKQPILVVGNKVDLLPKDGRDYLHRVKNVLVQAIYDYGVDNGHNVKNVSLISAKTGYGIEELITNIHTNWGTSGDIYLIGCTNVGKSTLFNSLLQSDLCKVKAMDLIQRATISIWPGTTLNLLRFPVMRPTEWRLQLRMKRLQSWRYAMKQENMLRQHQLKETNDPKYATLIGHVGLTFKSNRVEDFVAASKDAFKLSSGINADVSRRRLQKFDPNEYEYKSGKWLHDTPGSVHKEQIITLLTMEELAWTIPKKYTPPRCFIIQPKQTMFLAGLGRIDYVEGEFPMTTMIFSSPELPVTVLPTSFADDFYNKYLGTYVLKVPCGDFERLKEFPALVPKEFTLIGQGGKQCCADILLSSAGWISFVHRIKMEAKILAYTPDGRGCHIRKLPLLKYAIRLRGKRLFYTPACHPSKVSVEREEDYY